MIPRYSDKRITALFSDDAKVARWDCVELAVIKARASLGLIDRHVYDAVVAALSAHPCDIEWWHAREEETKHDLAAYVDERMRRIPVEHQHAFHQDMTSYDTEDSAFILALITATDIVLAEGETLLEALLEQAEQHMDTAMLERTHGQWAKLRTFGGRILTWYAPLKQCMERLKRERDECVYSRISGAIGNYGGGMTPDIEREALSVLGLRPFYGATQILSRVTLLPLVHALGNTAEAIAQIAMDFRLGARSGMTLWHEPFGAKQKGSSAMPHKKNPINTEQMGGMLNLARGYVQSIVLSSQTWEGRAIEQSCVERVAVPDLFHVLLRMTSVMRKVIAGMVVYDHTMFEEIRMSRGTYASDEAKNFLAAECGKKGVPFEVAYRIIQLAAFNAFAPTSGPVRSIDHIILSGTLRINPALDATSGDVATWNKMLLSIFGQKSVHEQWKDLFNPSNLLKHERFLFEQVVGRKL